MVDLAVRSALLPSAANRIRARPTCAVCAHSTRPHGRSAACSQARLPHGRAQRSLETENSGWSQSAARSMVMCIGRARGKSRAPCFRRAWKVRTCESQASSPSLSSDSGLPGDVARLETMAIPRVHQTPARAQAARQIPVASQAPVPRVRGREDPALMARTRVPEAATSRTVERMLHRQTSPSCVSRSAPLARTARYAVRSSATRSPIPACPRRACPPAAPA
jgi:hypothetical protein